MRHYNVIIEKRNFFDQPVKNGLISYDNVQRISADESDDYTTGYLLEYSYFE